MEITTIGIDLAKHVFQLHGVDGAGKDVLKKQLRREQLLPFFVQLPPCLIGMEACSGAHFWARKLQALGHRVRLMAPQFVKPYVKSNKNDAADAQAICEAVARPSMRFVAIKSPEQQAVLSLHRARQGFVRARTAQGNQIRGLLAEFGLIAPQGLCSLRQRVPELIEDASNELPGALRLLIQDLMAHLKVLDQQIEQLQQQIQDWHRGNEVSQRLGQIPGIGAITASALVASVGDAAQFKNGRELSAWMGLVPRQHSSGGKGSAAGHQQARGRLLAHLAHSRGQSAGAPGAAAPGSVCVAAWADRPKQRQCGSGRAGQQERSRGVGVDGAWNGLARAADEGAGIRGAAGQRQQQRQQQKSTGGGVPPIARAISSDGTTGQTGVGTTRLGPSSQRAPEPIEEPTSGFHQGPRMHAQQPGYTTAIFSCQP